MCEYEKIQRHHLILRSTLAMMFLLVYVLPPYCAVSGRFVKANDLSTIYLGKLPKVSEFTLFQANKQIEPQINEIVSLIESCPDWTRLVENDPKSVSLIIETLNKISKYDIGFIRDAISKFTENTKSKEPSRIWISNFGKVLLLNRYIFNVPAMSKLDKSTAFGGWAGVPGSATEISWLWPFSYNINGDIELTGKYAGYYGPDYLGINEFDYFNKTFGIRKQFDKK